MLAFTAPVWMLMKMVTGSADNVAIAPAAQKYVDTLGLQKQSFGNYFATEYTSDVTVSGLPVQFAGGTRKLSSSIYNLFASVGSAGQSQRGFPLHQLKGDETWYYHDGDGPIILYMFDFASGTVRNISVGRVDPTLGDTSPRPQFTVPGMSWTGALLRADATWAMTAAQTTPAFDPRDSTMAGGNQSLLANFYTAFPAHRALIQRLTSFGS